MNSNATTRRGVPRSISKHLGSALQSRPVSSLARRVTVGKLRILAYHGVDDVTHFDRVVTRIVARYTPVDGDDVVAALSGAEPLPPRAVWFTFDDGLRSTLDAAEMLASHRVRATAFVNPASIAPPSLLWFQILELAEQLDLIRPGEAERFSRHRLKTCPDLERRAAVADLGTRVAAQGLGPATLSGKVDDLRGWVAAGHEVGNHTWDHPCLDMCTEEDQVRQIEEAHTWLVEHGFAPRFFAYPNGNWSGQSESTARRLGYRSSVLFDHRLADVAGDPHRLSRLRISSSASERRVESILSGAHSAFLGMRHRRLQPRKAHPTPSRHT